MTTHYAPSVRQAQASIFDRSRAVNGEPSCLELLESGQFDSKLTGEINERASQLENLVSSILSAVETAATDSAMSLEASMLSVEPETQEATALSHTLQLRGTFEDLWTTFRKSLGDLVRFKYHYQIFGQDKDIRKFTDAESQAQSVEAMLQDKHVRMEEILKDVAAGVAQSTLPLTAEQAPEARRALLKALCT